MPIFAGHRREMPVLTHTALRPRNHRTRQHRARAHRGEPYETHAPPRPTLVPSVVGTCVLSRDIISQICDCLAFSAHPTEPGRQTRARVSRGTRHGGRFRRFRHGRRGPEGGCDYVRGADVRLERRGQVRCGSGCVKRNDRGWGCRGWWKRWGAWRAGRAGRSAGEEETRRMEDEQ